MSNLALAVPFFIATAAPPPPTTSYTIARTLDRTFVDTPASGGGNISPDTFTHNGQSWEVWQVVPYLGSGVSPVQRGDARVHIRNRNVRRNDMELSDLPERITIFAAAGQTADWVQLPWNFTRPTNTAKFSRPGGGNSARVSADYEPAGRTPLANASVSGIAQGETFSITLFFD